MPLSAHPRPRNMFPPPTTTATWTPSRTTATISLAMRCTTPGEMPSGSSPEKASPDSLTTTRRQGVCRRASSRAAAPSEAAAGWPLASAPPSVTREPSRTPEPSRRAAPSPLSALFSTRPLLAYPVSRRSSACLASACLADLEPGERPYRDALLTEHLLARLLGIPDERLLDERDILEERAEPTLDDLGDRLLGLALVPGDLLREVAFVRDSK